MISRQLSEMVPRLEQLPQRLRGSPSDKRGTAEYRTKVACVLARRAAGAKARIERHIDREVKP